MNTSDDPTSGIGGGPHQPGWAFSVVGAFEQELQDFFENASVGLHWVGPDGVIQRANRAELELLGYEPSEYIGHHVAEFHADPQVIESILQRLGRGETLCNQEARFPRRGRLPRPRSRPGARRDGVLQQAGQGA